MGASQSGDYLPLVIEPSIEAVNLIAWAQANKQMIACQLLKYGAILFRNFNIGDAVKFDEFLKTVSGEVLEYKERSSPRTRVRGNVYTSTDYPKEHSIFIHNENSYQQSWPLRIFFCCVTAAQQGGETPIADCRKVYGHLSPTIREQFARKNWMYVRNFNKNFGLPWQEVFQTTDHARVEQHCRRAGIVAEWRSDEHLRVSAVRSAMSRHPQTGETIWFNHATFFHVSTLAPAVGAELLRSISEEDLPANTYYGDGSPIEPAVLEELRNAYTSEQISFTWKRGDLLMLDNMLVAHGRAPYQGPRRILAGMAEPSGDAAVASGRNQP
jgi:alpha-ketoglutarate-dependent taurine dioxygenase